MKTQDSINRQKYSKYYKIPGLKTWKYSKINLYFGDLACWFKNIKKYLPVVESAVKEGKTLASNLALLTDRIALREGGKQIYGSQVWIDKNTGKKYFQPIENPDKVDSYGQKLVFPICKPFFSWLFRWIGVWNSIGIYRN